MRKQYIVIGIILLLSCENKNQEKNTFEKINLSDKEILKEIRDSTSHNVIGKDEFITDEKTAISIAQPILFNGYRKDNILKQRPYKIGKVKNYWIIYGNIPKNQIGGVFEIIIDSKNGEIIRLTHGE